MMGLDLYDTLKEAIASAARDFENLTPLLLRVAAT